MMRKPHAMLMIGGCWTLLLVMLLQTGPVDYYVETIKQQATKVDRPLHREEEWRNLIESWKPKFEQQPIDAYLDTVWKAVPGYNGRKIDVEASLLKMESFGSANEEHLVFREISPAVSLEELGAHPTYRGNPKKPAVSFMINVAWGNEYLDPILDTLDKAQVKTTFFLDGSWVKRHPELAKKIAERGHELGNHAYSHPNMSRLSANRIHEEIAKTQAIIEKAVGIKPTLFAPPSGDFSQQVVTIARQDFQMKTILWTADTIDWQRPPTDVLISRIGKKLGNGVLVLMHPTKPTAEALPTLIRMAKERGLTPTTVSELLSSKRLDSR